METKFILIAFTLVLLAAHQVSAGAKLTCYTCNSHDDPNCPFEGFDSDRYTGKEVNCSQSARETMTAVQNILYPNHHEELVEPLGISKIDEERCVKFTAKSRNGDKPVTFRGCMLNGHYTCAHIQSVLQNANADLEQCDFCKHKYNCNSSSIARLSLLSVVGAIILSLMSH
ncbi:Hypothetical predicted protein [Cloeon dipterum]|uniref:Protein sleepless n=1 Tax=Cloeon dipterum TaxID=197152 RepID=A0A8S1D3Y1_9INSE|nr:Hypothetical predicted protein [Cloeon dipterum]